MAIKSDEQTITKELTGVALDTVKEIRRKKYLIPLLIGALCLVAITVYFTAVFPLIKEAESAGRSTGENSGYIAGMAVGSVEGAKRGIPTGYTEGRNEGLSANDTVTEIGNTITALGNLEVLVANVDLTTYHEDGNKYGALYLTRGSAVFTIDLNNVTVTYKENPGIITIELPRPAAEIKIDLSEPELIAEWQTKFFNGTDSEGFQALLNSLKQTNNISESEVANYPVLFDLASRSAIKQVEALANSVRGDTDIKVTVNMQSD